MLFQGFSQQTFLFLKNLAANNQKDWFNANRQDFLKHLEHPFRALITELAPFLNTRLPELEISAKTGKTLSRINKNIFGKTKIGLYNTEYWAAFYRKEHKKQTDLQLFLGIRPNGFYVGLYCSHRASEILNKLRTYISNNTTRFLILINNLRFSINIYTEDKLLTPLTITSSNDLAKLNKGKCLALLRYFPCNSEILHSPKLLIAIEETFEALLPIYQQVIANNAEPLEIDEVLEFIEEDDIELTYDLEDLKQETYLEEDFIKQIQHLLINKKQIIFYGSPGTGKTFVAERFAQYFIKGKGEYKLIQFHPSYSYEDFIEGIRPTTLESGSSLSYQVQDGIFKKFCQKARDLKDAIFVLIIDEINRGNITRIFGELLYLLEYRNNTVELPYSKKPFNIPQNLYIIGTMNTADRSTALLDHALRRRFHFIALTPNVNILRKFLQDNSPTQEWIADLLLKLNQQLATYGISNEYHIGHSHFMIRNIDFSQLTLIWNFTIIPTLEEYFHNRPEVLSKFSLEELSRGLIDQKHLSTQRTQ